MTTTTPTLPVGAADTDHAVRLAANTLTTAFLAGPLSDWLLPDLAARQRAFHGYFTVIARHASSGTGWIDTAADGDAAAVWYPHGHGGEPDVVPADYETRLQAACGDHADKFLTLDELMHPAFPADLDYAYLGYVGVAPWLQGRGIGGGLLTHQHQKLDADGVTAFLIASSDDSPRLYERLGYRYYGQPIQLPDSGPAMYPMVRDPQPAG